MATSLEELLAKEGFRGGRSGTRARPSFKAEAASMPRYPSGDQGKRDSPLGPSMRRIKTERTRSEFTRGSKDVEEDKTVKVETLEGVKGREIVEAGVEENDKFKDKHSDRAYYSERTERGPKGNGRKERQGEGKGKDKKVPERNHSISNENLEKHSESSNDNRGSVDQSGAVYESSVRGSKIGNGFEDDQRPKNEKRTPTVPEIALDEVAIKAVISILNGYVKSFLKDAEFRTTVRHNCFCSLASIEIEEGNSFESKAKANLEQAIEAVEKAVEAAAGTKDLKTAALLLVVITRLNSNDLKHDYTSGTPNSRLSACAHIYLSVIYKLRKKDKVSAKHLLQVFCDSPFLARKLLLSELWDYLFFPHLSHLKNWYKQEADPLFNTASKVTKLKFLDKVYNEVLDSCTYQFAVYYKDWLTEGVKAPSIPSVNIPFISLQGGSRDHSSGPASPAAPFSPQPMASKKLYDAVFGHSSKPRVYDAEENGKADNFNNGGNSSGSSPIRVKQTLTSSSEMVKYPGQDIENHSPENLQDTTSFPENGPLEASDEEWKLGNASVSPDTDLKHDTRKSSARQVSAGDTHTLNSSSHTKENELTLKTLASKICFRNTTN
ncbi:hypothetical protein DKX38_005230 [Salix brachista]|uniref:Putative E3 ubiquitin-protein ligase LIN N-terminal domain-containing protein n=1 Tax=Salix brachista TaxID=2182728 RepID=A0A5N5NFE6_9ROSI|nr:hypothetical protein DKX38_005230 [Salix brachista]